MSNQEPGTIIHPSWISEEMLRFAKSDDLWHFKATLNAMIKYGYCDKCGLTPHGCEREGCRSIGKERVPPTIKYIVQERYVNSEIWKDDVGQPSDKTNAIEEAQIFLKREQDSQNHSKNFEHRIVERTDKVIYDV